MSTGLIRNDEDRELVVPQQTAAAISDQRRAVAEIQAALTVAQARPRDEVAAIKKIEIACQRPGVAADSTYEFKRGGEEIAGPNIRIMEVIAGYWGNLQYGFRELEQNHRESQFEAFAWDLENNVKATRVFVVPHAMKAHGKMKELTDPTDVYYNSANSAQRKVRACLQAVIPRDVVESAIVVCTETMKANVKLDDETRKKLVDGFASIKVTREQIEKRIQRPIASITPAQFVKMRKIFCSLRDGESKIEDWFEVAKEDAPQPSTLKEKLKAKTKPSEPEQDPAARAIDAHGADETRPSELPADEQLTAEEKAELDRLAAMDAAEPKRKQRELMS